MPSDTSPQPEWLTKEVKDLFEDPRFKHLRMFADFDDDEPDQLNYDRAMTLQAIAAVYSIRSSEQQGRTLAWATWGLVIATVGLVIATIVLIVVTANGS